MAKKRSMKAINFVLTLIVLLALVGYAGSILFGFDVLMAIAFNNVLAHKILVGIAGVVGVIGVIGLLMQTFKR